MKIAVLTQYFPVREEPYRGHSAYQTLLRLKAWADIEVIAPQAKYPSWLPPRSRRWTSTDLSYTDSEFRATYLAYPAIPVLSRALSGRLVARLVEPHLRRIKPDVILNYWLYPEGYAAVEVGRELGIPVVLTAIGSDVNRSAGIAARRSKSAMQRADLTLTVSEALRQKVLEMGISPRKVQAILNGCDINVFCPADAMQARNELGISSDQKLIVYVGRYDLLKGLRELVEATARIVPQHPEVALALVGEGPALETLKVLASQLGIAERVCFVGPFKSQQVSRWLAACDVFCLPSYAEGCPNAVIEALNCGRPVVASNVGGIPELVGSNCGVLIPPRRVDLLATALAESLDRVWDHRHIATVSYRGWEQVAADNLSALERVVSGHTRARVSSMTETVNR
jgi:glycosyltransferase involved in cell wall biosynthesis